MVTFICLIIAVIVRSDLVFKILARSLSRPNTILRKLMFCLLLILQACKLKFGDLKGALLDTDFAMREGDNNVKALFRQGQVDICY